MHPSLSGYSVMLGKGVFLGGKRLGYGKLTLMFEPIVLRCYCSEKC